ncbi:cysteine--tRNA ligase, partial [Candidatus Kaiserbacteria bacterium CG_4_9_14_0_2_um_filter_41_32]
YEDYKNKATMPDPAYVTRFTEAINNDLDTPKAIALLFEITKDTNLSDSVKCATIKHFDKVLGIGMSEELDDALFLLGVLSLDEIPSEIQILVNEREAARIARNWDESDRLRSELNIKGYTVEDGPNGPKISKAN